MAKNGNGYSEAVWAKIRDAFERGTSVRDLEAMGPKRKAIYARANNPEDPWDRSKRNGNGHNGRPTRKQGNRKQRGKTRGGNRKQAKARSEKRQPGQRWTEHERAEALKVYVETASVIQTAKLTGVPARTIYRWLDEDPRWREAAALASRVCARILEDRSEAILVNLVRHAERGDGKDASAAMRGIDTLTKTLSFVRGGPTDRVEGAVTPEEWRRGREKPL